MFQTRGYAETTMESIAAASEIHAATLYRYFPSKDLIVFADFATAAEQLMHILEATPTSVPLPQALFDAIVAISGDKREGHMERRLIRTIIDQSPAARARVWDLQAEQRRRVGEFIAARTGRQVDDFSVILSARTVVLLIETTADIWRSGHEEVSGSDIARDLLAVLRSGEMILPAAE